MVSEDLIQHKWTEVKTGLKNIWGKLTDEDVESVRGDIYEIGEIIEQKYGESKEETQTKIESLLDSFDNKSDKGQRPNHHSYMRSPLGEPDHPFDAGDELINGKSFAEINADDHLRSKTDHVNTSPQRLTPGKGH